ncbi:MAG: hypothetical protein QXG65_03180 [Thermoplasmata archaeon]
MSAPETVEARLQRLEAELAKQRARLDALERQLAAVAEHPVDAKMTRSKVAYDWQT